MVLHDTFICRRRAAADRSRAGGGATSTRTMVQLFEDYPATESLLLWYPTVVVAAELTLPLTRRNVDKSVQLPVTYASTAFFLTLINLETAHFKILLVLYHICSLLSLEPIAKKKASPHIFTSLQGVLDRKHAGGTASLYCSHSGRLPLTINS